MNNEQKIKLPNPTEHLALIALDKPCINCNEIHGNLYTKKRIYCVSCKAKIKQ